MTDTTTAITQTTSPWDAIRVMAFGAIVPLALLIAPVLAERLVAERGLSPAQTGLYFLFELGGISLASLPALWWTGRWPTGRIATVAACGFILANLLSTIPMGLAPLLAVRLVAALAGGTLMILTMRIAGTAPNRQRLFGMWIAAQLGLAAVVLPVLPDVFERFGLAAFYALLGGGMVLLLPLAPGFAGAGPGAAGPQVQGRGTIAGVMVAVMLFYIGLGGCWAYVSLIAKGAGLDAQHVANRLAGATLLGIAGAGLAAVTGGHLRPRCLLVPGYVALMVAILALSFRLDLMRFAMAVGLFKFAWTFTLPAILATIAALDRSGAIMGPVNLVIGLGTAAGPFLAGMVLQGWGMTAMLVSCAGAIGLSMALVLLIEARWTA